MKSDAEYMREAYNIFLSLQKDVKACNFGHRPNGYENQKKLTGGF